MKRADIDPKVVDLPPQWQQLLGSKPIALTKITLESWLKRHFDFNTVSSSQQLKKLKDRGMSTRELALTALANGIVSSRKVVSNTTMNNAAAFAQKAFACQASEKIKSFIDSGGSRNHKSETRQATSFHATKKRPCARRLKRGNQHCRRKSSIDQ
jgi:hypothetical protein